LVEVATECFEVRSPLRQEIAGPPLNIGQGGRVEGVDASLSVSAVRGHAALAQNSKVARDGRAADREARCDVTRSALGLGQHFDDLPSDWIGKGSKRLHDPLSN
jgi:hypothetical protein